MHGFVSEKHHVSFFKFGRASVHFRLFCRVDKYSPFHLVQNRSESVCTRFYSDLYISLSVNSPRFLETHASGVFCESNVAGVRIKGVAASVETDTNGLLLIIADTSAIKVASTSWVRFPSCILESRVQYSSRRADYTFSCPSHVGGTRGVKYPCTSCLKEVVLYLSVFNIYVLDSEVFCGSYKIGSTIRPIQFDFASD